MFNTENIRNNTYNTLNTKHYYLKVYPYYLHGRANLEVLSFNYYSYF